MTGVDGAAVAVLTKNGSFLRAAERRHLADVLVSAIIWVYWVHVDSQKVQEGLFTATRCLKVLRHHIFVNCLDSFRRQLENGAVRVTNIRQIYHVNTATICIDNVDLTF